MIELITTQSPTRLAQAFHRRFWLVRRKLWRTDLSKPRLYDLRGTPLLVLPDVFDGVLLRTGVFLSESLRELDLKDTRVLDLGCGSGVGAVFAAQRGARVIASDLNPHAARNAQLNALLSQLAQRIETRVGDLFDPVRAERFDLILFNPPYYHGIPRDAADLAWRSPNVFERFLRELPAHLTPNGRARIVLSSDGDILHSLETESRLRKRIVRQHDLRNETVTVYDLVPT